MREIENSNNLIEVSLPDDSVLIRQLSTEDVQSYFDLMSADRVHFSQFDDGMTDRYKTVADVQESIVSTNSNRYRFGIWDNARMVGGINLGEHDDTSAEVGFWVGTEHVGNGYASRALKSIIVFGFEYLGKDELFANVLIGNDASRVTLEKVGFVHTEDDDGYWVFRIKRGSNGD